MTVRVLGPQVSGSAGSVVVEEEHVTAWTFAEETELDEHIRESLKVIPARGPHNMDYTPKRWP